MMIIIRGNTLYETDDYEEIQEAFEGYIYGNHRGEDEHDDKKRIQDDYEYAKWITRKRKGNYYKS